MHNHLYLLKRVASVPSSVCLSVCLSVCNIFLFAEQTRSAQNESTNVIYLQIVNILLSVLDLVRIFQGGSWGHGGLKPQAETWRCQKSITVQGKEQVQTGMGFKLCLIAPLERISLRGARKVHHGGEGDGNGLCGASNIEIRINLQCKTQFGKFKMIFSGFLFILQA